MSCRAFSTVSFPAPFPVISSEARNLGLGVKISQSPPLTSFAVSSFEMTRGVLLCSPIRARKGSFEMTGGASQAVLFFVIWGVPLLVISPVFNHVISSVPSLSFRAPLPVISSEARNLEPKAKISQSQPLTFVRGRSFEMTRGISSCPVFCYMGGSPSCHLARFQPCHSEHLFLSFRAKREILALGKRFLSRSPSRSFGGAPSK